MMKRREFTADDVIYSQTTIKNARNAIKKVLERFRGQNAAAVIAQIDRENNPQAMAALGIERVPIMLITKGDQEVFRKVGLFNVKELTTMYSKT